MNSYYPKGTDLSFESISHESERELFRQAKAGDGAAKEKLLRLHLLFVASLARRLSRGKLPDDEIVSAANYALVSAFDRFDPAFPNRFAAFLKLYVRGAIAKVWGEQNIVSRSDFSDGVPVVSVPIVESPEEDTSSEERDHKEFLLTLVEQAKLVLDPREKEIVRLLFCEVPSSQSVVARQLGLSRERIRQIFDVALHKLQKETRRLMNEHGIE